jgi:hypothetical protein
LSDVTIPAIMSRTVLRYPELAYLPITFLDEVRYTCIKIVKGS